jgi:hypothetical protein
MKSLAHWRPYLGWTEHPFIIHTDHTNLQYWKSPQNLNRRMARWHADLQEYNYEIKYIPGPTNTAADALSRPPGVDKGDNDNQQIVIIPPSRCQAVNTTPTNGILIPEEEEHLKRSLMLLYHDHPTAGHPGRDETV